MFHKGDSANDHVQTTICRIRWCWACVDTSVCVGVRICAFRSIHDTIYNAHHTAACRRTGGNDGGAMADIARVARYD